MIFLNYMDELKVFSDITGYGLAALAIGFAYWVLKYKKNGNGNGIKDDIAIIKSNHLTHIQADVTRLIDGQNTLIKYQEKQLYILEEIKQKLKT